MKSRISRRNFLASAAATVVPAALAHARPRIAASLSSLAGAPPCETSADSWKRAGVIDVSGSPFAKLRTVPVSSVEIREGFWSQRRATNIDSSIPSMHDELIAHGRMDNFLRLEGKSSAPQIGPVYSDSDIYKWTEAVGFALQSADQPQAPRNRRSDDSGSGRRTGAQRLSRTPTTRATASRCACNMTHRRPATNSTASGTCYREQSPLSRHRRPDSARCRHSLCRRFSAAELRPGRKPEGHRGRPS